MTFNEYQKLTNRTKMTFASFKDERSYLSLALNGEAGEVAEYVKKTLWHNKLDDIEEIKKEIGDVLWYLAALCECYGLELQDVAECNIEKLKQRHPQGFTSNYQS